MDRLCSAFIVWLRDRVIREGGQAAWDLMVAWLDTPPVVTVPGEEPVARPAALPPGAPVTPAEQAASFDAFAGAVGRRG